MTLDFNHNNFLDKINRALEKNVPYIDLYESDLIKAMKYSLLNPGKRLRALLTLEFSSACGGNIESSLPFACAVEMIHTYSLIHDDLPCMDNDDLRRGKPSNHIVFGESTALLAGDALLNLAFETMLNSEATNDKNLQPRALCCAKELAKASGISGMIGGQAIDLKYENKKMSAKMIADMYSKKTSAIIIAACKMGCIISGCSDEQINSAEEYAKALGLAFQIVDDILDLNSDEKTLGKPINSDIKSQKSTYVSLVGLETAKQAVEKLTKQAVLSLDNFSGDVSFLKDLAIYLSTRKN